MKNHLNRGHKMSHDVTLADSSASSNHKNQPITHRTKLVRVQNSISSKNDSKHFHSELSMNHPKSRFRAVDKLPSAYTYEVSTPDSIVCNEEAKFHPELTDRYDFKEGKHCIISPSSPLTHESNPEATPCEIEHIGPKSFIPIMILGRGSFGEVYLVQKKTTSKYYAMKVLQKSKLMGQNLVKYARTERNVLSYTKHSFIVGLNYAFQTKSKLFLILDYCPGGDLGHVLVREKRFDEHRAKMYLAEIVLALEDLHRRDIIFRDLKPDNVVIDEQGHALLTDFGLSKEGICDNKGAKSFCGSIAYLAPEMLKRSGHGKSVDWYLCGVLLYEMLVGVPPYFTQDKDQMFYNIQKGCLKIPANLSLEAKSLLIGLLNRNPQKRLGASKYDAEDIKNHPFFNDIDWDMALRRELNPPKPKAKPIIPHDISPSIFYDDFEEDESDQKVPGWSFANQVDQSPEN